MVEFLIPNVTSQRLSWKIVILHAVLSLSPGPWIGFWEISPQISSSHKLMKLRSYWKPVVTVCIFFCLCPHPILLSEQIYVYICIYYDNQHQESACVSRNYKCKYFAFCNKFVFASNRKLLLSGLFMFVCWCEWSVVCVDCYTLGTVVGLTVAVFTFYLWWCIRKFAA